MLRTKTPKSLFKTEKNNFKKRPQVNLEKKAVANVNNKLEDVDNIKDSLHSIAKITTENTVEINKTKDELRSVVEGVGMVVKNLHRMKNIEESIVSAINGITSNMQKESFKLFEFLIPSCPR